jgi:hypothetical protein
MKNDASCRVTPALGGSYRSDSEKEFGHSDKCGNLTNPEKKHPFLERLGLKTGDAVNMSFRLF